MPSNATFTNVQHALTNMRSAYGKSGLAGVPTTTLDVDGSAHRRGPQGRGNTELYPLLIPRNALDDVISNKQWLDRRDYRHDLDIQAAQSDQR